MSANSTDAYWKNLDAAQKIQEKFDFYLASLPFAVLALSVQVGLASPSVWATALELVGRAALLTSGLAALYRLEGMPKLFQGRAYSIDDDQRIQEAVRLKQRPSPSARDALTGAEVDLDAHIAFLKEHKAEIAEAEHKLLSHTRVSYKIHRWGVVLGFVALTISRSWHELTSFVARF